MERRGLMVENDPSPVFALTDRELWVVTSRAEGRRGGLIATFVDQASICAEAPRVLLGLGRRHHTHELVEASRAFALHLIGEERLEWVWRFGLETGRGRDKLAGLAVREGPSGTPILEGAVAWLDCRVEESFSTGDRTVYLAEVLASGREGVGRPLTAKRLLELAPTPKRRLLEETYVRDAAADLEAIRAYRARRRS